MYILFKYWERLKEKEWEKLGDVNGDENWRDTERQRHRARYSEKERENVTEKKTKRNSQWAGYFWGNEFKEDICFLMVLLEWLHTRKF